MDMTSYILGRKSQGGGGGGTSMPRRIIEVEDGSVNTTKNKEVLTQIYNDYKEGKIIFDGVYLKDASQDWPDEYTYFSLANIHLNDNEAFMQLGFYDTGTTTTKDIKFLKVGCNITNNEVSYVVMSYQNCTSSFAEKDSSENITGEWTFAQLPQSSATPTSNNQFVNKLYVDGLIGDINTILATLTTPEEPASL